MLLVIEHCDTFLFTISFFCSAFDCLVC